MINGFFKELDELNRLGEAVETEVHVLEWRMDRWK